MTEEVIEVENVGLCPECRKPVDIALYVTHSDAECFACGWAESYPMDDE